MKFLEHELAAQEREMNLKHDTGAETTATPVKTENTDVLARRFRELEAMVKGLTEEILDLKSVTRKLSQQLEDMRVGQSKIHAESRFCQKKSEVTPEQAGNSSPAVTSHQVLPRAFTSGRPIAEPDKELRGTAPRTGTSRHAVSVPAPELTPAPESDVPIDQLKAGEFEYVMQPDGTIQKRRKTSDHSVIIAGTGYNPGHVSCSAAIRTDSDTVIEASDDDIEMDSFKKRR
ncbi:MAG: hypothetical protein LBU24_01745 [Methanocalculaceae archaeon]|nr:hypothetical protein [Methanocalculaceae archaeon]